MTKVYILIGTPASGKTTWVKNQAFTAEDTTVVSMDDIRKELTGDTTCQDFNYEVAKEAHRRFEEALNDHTPIIVWDATSVLRKYRKKLRDMVWNAKYNRNNKDFTYEIIGVYFNIPLEIALERNKNRDRVVPEHVIKEMFNMLQATCAPTRLEGYDTIIEVTE